MRCILLMRKQTGDLVWLRISYEATEKSFKDDIYESLMLQIKSKLSAEIFKNEIHNDKKNN